eukprot:scaffold6994_cov120-Cylindrotheca_fusiformis.AAC.3
MHHPKRRLGNTEGNAEEHNQPMNLAANMKADFTKGCLPHVVVLAMIAVLFRRPGTPIRQVIEDSKFDVVVAWDMSSEVPRRNKSTRTWYDPLPISAATARRQR